MTIGILQGRQGWSRDARVAFGSWTAQNELGSLKRPRPPLSPCETAQVPGFCGGPEKEKNMKAELIIPLEALKGALRKDGYYFRLYKGRQIVLDSWLRPLSSRAPSYSGIVATTACLCISGNKIHLAVVHPSGPLSVISVLLSSFYLFIFHFLSLLFH